MCAQPVTMPPSPLLPPTQVLTAGSDVTWDQTAEIWRPPYLNKGAQPEILEAPSFVRPGEQLQIPYTSTDPIARSILIRNNAVTHSMSFGEPAWHRGGGGRAAGGGSGGGSWGRQAGQPAVSGRRAWQAGVTPGIRQVGKGTSLGVSPCTCTAMYVWQGIAKVACVAQTSPHGAALQIPERCGSLCRPTPTARSAWPCLPTATWCRPACERDQGQLTGGCVVLDSAD